MGYELSLDVLRAGQLSRELLESQQRMRLAASAADLSLWEWDIIRDEIWTTEKGRERAGIPASERIDFARYLQSVHPDDREPTQRAVRHALEVSGEYEAEYRVMAWDSAPRWVVARGQVERDAQGKPLRLRGVSVDVTERKHAEAELRRLQGELAHVSRVSTMGQLASSLAHELNQPLGAILRNAEAAELFLQSDLPDLDEIRAILADIRQDDQRAGAVIDRMRAMLKRRESQGAPLDMNALVSEVTALVRLDAEARKTQIALAPATPVPPVWADRVQLQQVVLNLLLNAMDAMSGCPPPERRVSVYVRGVATGVEVAVSDAGPGIPEENLQRVFDPFFTTKPGGLGMGLAISQTIIAAHGGRFTAENNGNGGATFRITLPAAKPERSPA
jgi:C4-dicarboxylate-specific signal transduction histidine kinase